MALALMDVRTTTPALTLITADDELFDNPFNTNQSALGMTVLCPICGSDTIPQHYYVGGVGYDWYRDCARDKYHFSQRVLSHS